ncbi:hypothetical protein LINGRAPRIM_LOCUS3277 [Linum grandiflorum]
MYPKLHRIRFCSWTMISYFTGLWKIDMHGKVNGAIETFFGS